MAGFRDLMRYCDTLAEYEAAKANGTVTDDTLVIVVQDKVAKFKGKTFDWSGGVDTSSLATKEELENLTNEILKNEEVSAAAFNDLNQRVDNVDISLDSELSDTSTNAVENKAIKSYVDVEVAKKVDKVSGKQLSTEDFTSALKTKLEGLNNYDDTDIQNAVNSLTTQINTLVSGDASTAIESFNEIIAFLNGVEDSESLDSIIASIEQQIANKQEKIDDLDTIRSGAALGATALQEHQDISHLATKEEVTNLQNEVIANEEVVAAAFNDVNERINAISENVSGTTVTKEELESTVETINQTISDNKSATDTAIEGLETSIGNVDAKFANYATTESLTTEITNLTNEIIANEEVVASALNDLNERLNNGGGSSNGSGVVTFYTTVGELSSEYKAKNAVAYASFLALTGECTTIVKSLDIPGTIVTMPCMTFGAEDSLVLMAFNTDIMDLEGGFTKQTYIALPDGSVTLQLN